MGLFDFLKKKNNKQAVKAQSEPIGKVAPTVPKDQKKYYKADDYYTTKVHEGTVFEKSVITFEQRKKTCIPSERGLYVAEILLLEYCAYGDYPKPKDGYPGFWWFQYGIRDVATALKSLEDRGFIQFGSPKDAVVGWKVADLKEFLQKFDAPTTGKKDDLVARVQKTVSDDALFEMGVEPKYKLTELGKSELEENAYVPYMHKHPNTTTEDDRFGKPFNVWSINKVLGCGDKSNWKLVVDRMESEMQKEREKHNGQFMKELEKIDPKGYDMIKAQDDQLNLIMNAEAKYGADKDIDFIIAFWEQLWTDGGLIFEGSHWHFRLADLYISQKRYDDAIAFCKHIKKKKKNYSDKADSYIQRIEEKKNKATKRK